jgi:hypothetical protein
MPSVMLTLKPGLSDAAHQDVLRRVQALPGIRKAGPINPNAKTAEMRQFCKLLVDEGVELNPIIAQLKTFPEVAYAELPPQRSLIQPVPNPIVG